MLADQRLQLLHNLGMGAQRQLCLDQLLQGGDPHVVKTGDLALREGLVRQLRQRRAAPQGQRPFERRNGTLGTAAGQLAPPLGHEPLEAVRIELLGIEPQLVAAPARHDHPLRSVAGPGGERLTQAGDMHLHGLGGVGGWTLAPELIDQPVRAERLVEVQQQQRQQRPLLAAPERDRAALDEDLERTENAEVHASGHASRLNPTYSSPGPAPSPIVRHVPTTTAVPRGEALDFVTDAW